MTVGTGAADPDVVVIGAGPNGLTAAAVLAQSGLEVLVLEASEHIGGAVRTAEVTRPGFKHDIFSGFYPLFPVGPIGRLPLDQYGLEWRAFDKPFAGAASGGGGVSLHRDLERTIESFSRAGQGDGYERLWRLWDRGGPAVLDFLFNPIGSPAPLVAAHRLGSASRLLELAQVSVSPARMVAERYFESDDARVWYIGSPLHSDLGPSDAGGGLYGLVMMGLAQQVGMPIPAGGAQAISNALARMVESLGGRILTDHPATRVIVRTGRAAAVEANGVEIRARRGVLATIPPTLLFGSLIAPDLLPTDFLQAVKRFRWGTGVFKLDLALNGLPTFTGSELNGAGVLHLGRTSNDLGTATQQIADNLLPQAPPIIGGIHTLADSTRAPDGCHTLWIETHAPSVPAGDAAHVLTDHDWESLREPFAERLIDEISMFAPDLRSHILDYHAQTPADLEAANANLVGGDIAGGSFTIDQQVVFRPVPGWFRHAMPIKGLYLGGASAHPGGGVHGAAGSNAARVLLEDLGMGAVSSTIQRGLGRALKWFDQR